MRTPPTSVSTVAIRPERAWCRPRVTPCRRSLGSGAWVPHPVHDSSGVDARERGSGACVTPGPCPRSGQLRRAVTLATLATLRGRRRSPALLGA
jgi:hypothetical protein